MTRSSTASVRVVEEGIELTTDALRLVVHVASGPRISWLGRRDGENVLYWAPGRHRRGEWDMLGGHRVWTTRGEAEESEETYRPDNEPCTYAIEEEGTGLRVTGAVDPLTRLERGFSIEAEGSERLRVDHFVRNAGTMLWSGGVWAVTVTMPASRYVVPLGGGGVWDVATLVLFDRWGDGQGGEGFADEQFHLTRDALVLFPSGRENKRMIGARAGEIVMHDSERDVLFAKSAAFVRGGRYPGGANLALYTGGPESRYVEMETMSPIVTLRPGEAVHHTEQWVVRRASSNAVPAGWAG